jgi:Fe-S cluster biogenesis protein NfuA
MSNSESIVQEALDSIRPFLQKDGGDVELVGIEGTRVMIKLLGACKTCSISHITMKAGVEESIKKVLPEITEVLAVD